MFEEYILTEESAGIAAEKVVVDLLQGSASVSINGDTLNLFTEDVIKGIVENTDSGVEMKAINIESKIAAFSVISKSEEWKRSCAVSANLICSKLIGNDRKGTVEVLHNKASVDFIKNLGFVRNLVKSTIGGTLDRWNPADIWLVSDSSSVTEAINKARSKDLKDRLEKAEALKDITKEFDSAFSSGNVIGISLKKIVLTKKNLNIDQEGDVEIDSVTPMSNTSNILFSSGSMFTDSVFEEGEFEANNGRIHCTFPSSSESNGTLRMVRKSDNRVAYELDGHSTFLGSSTKLKSLPSGSGSLYSYLVGDESGPIKDITVKDQIRQLVQHCVSEYSAKIEDESEENKGVIVTSAKHYRIA